MWWLPISTGAALPNGDGLTFRRPQIGRPEEEEKEVIPPPPQ